MKHGSLKAALAAGLRRAGLATPAGAQRADDMRGGGGNPCVGDAQSICSEFIPDRSKVASWPVPQQGRSSRTPCRAELGGGKTKASGKRRAPRQAKRRSKPLHPQMADAVVRCPE